MSLSDNGKLLAAVVQNKGVVILDLLENKSLETFRLDNSPHAVAFAPNNNLVAAAGVDNIIHVFDLEKKQVAKTLRSRTAGILSLTWSKDGTYLGASGKDGTARVWNFSTEEEVFATRAINGWLYQVSFSPDGKHVATASSDFFGRLYRFEPGEAEPVGMFEHEAEVHCISFSPDGGTLATGGFDYSVRFWDRRTAQPSRPLAKLPNPERIMSVAFSKDAKLLALLGYEGGLTVWNLTTTVPGKYESQPAELGSGDIAAVETGEMREVTNDSRGRVLRWAGNSLHIKNERGLNLQHSFPEQILFARFVGEKYIAVAAGNTLTLFTDNDIRPQKRFFGAGRLSDLAIFGDTIAIASSDDQLAGYPVLLYSLARETLLGQLGPFRDGIQKVRFSPAGERLLTCGEDFFALQWDLATFRPKGQPMRHRRQVEDACWSGDSEIIATLTRDGSLRLWEADTGFPLSGTVDLPFSAVRIWFQSDRTLQAEGGQKQKMSWDLRPSSPEQIFQLAPFLGGDRPSDSKRFSQFLGEALLSSPSWRMVQARKASRLADEFAAEFFTKSSR
jgi:WD40 repeat protein